MKSDGIIEGESSQYGEAKCVKTNEKSIGFIVNGYACIYMYKFNIILTFFFFFVNMLSWVNSVYFVYFYKDNLDLDSELFSSFHRQNYKKMGLGVIFNLAPRSNTNV